ncbi:hypothetical protein BDV96DRAFT_647069 [Lophiotrema nucula]|uniref:Uncharacterized protein n=1 Tax=Lophiotrema nucula TaxID=690887 RepID=A0A6A5Z7J9_9PLEO|nr:hypothetical protein BDV96DRAFT_647069 [Lophiotrema nucula]
MAFNVPIEKQQGAVITYPQEGPLEDTTITKARPFSFYAPKYTSLVGKINLVNSANALGTLFYVKKLINQLWAYFNEHVATYQELHIVEQYADCGVERILKLVVKGLSWRISKNQYPSGDTQQFDLFMDAHPKLAQAFKLAMTSDFNQSNGWYQSSDSEGNWPAHPGSNSAKASEGRPNFYRDACTQTPSLCTSPPSAEARIEPCEYE